MNPHIAYIHSCAHTIHIAPIRHAAHVCIYMDGTVSALYYAHALSAHCAHWRPIMEGPFFYTRTCQNFLPLVPWPKFLFRVFLRSVLCSNSRELDTCSSCTQLNPSTLSCTLMHSAALSCTLMYSTAPGCSRLLPAAPGCNLLHTPALNLTHIVYRLYSTA